MIPAAEFLLLQTILPLALQRLCPAQKKYTNE